METQPHQLKTTKRLKRRLGTAKMNHIFSIQVTLKLRHDHVWVLEGGQTPFERNVPRTEIVAESKPYSGGLENPCNAESVINP